ncbi:PREDICTED: glutamate receptor 2.8-like isoform X2 [Populus euphratica]|uniref:Glutamate receptor n=1 Tax=Populus euphratica TaxID=75702 RepID=A0AAJ6TK87_POPEU|nr:PREDICTED: glutamate receptor 2.8-like isoform X2 [Populus euphratica]
MRMAKQKGFFCFLCFLMAILWSEQVAMGKVIIRVGVVLDMNSAVGKTAESCISAAETDFYAKNADFRTRISLVTRDSKGDVVTAASAALDLMKNEEVEAIIGPQRSSEAKFVIELGAKTQVPILSFSATSPALTPVQSNYFIRTAQSDSSQVKVIASIVETYGWREIVLIYEGTEYGIALVPYLLKAFHEIGTRVPYESCIPSSFDDTEIMSELHKIKKMQESVFLVHMTASMGSRLFLLAESAGMMSEGSAWLVTTGLSTLLDPVDAKVMDSMEGVLGVKPYVPKSIELEGFKSRWKKNFNSENLFGLWAYDTVWAIAMAVEKAGIVRSRFFKQSASNRPVDLAALGISEMGPRLLKSILNTTFDGLSGKFQLVKGEMAPFAFEIFNVVGRSERVIGYWTQKGLSQSLDSSGKISHSNSKTKLKQPIWPGGTIQQPKKLRIGVPVRSGFSEFIEVKWHQQSNEPIVSGFSAEVFLAVLDTLPFPLPYEFIPFMNKSSRKSAGTYDDLLQQINQKFDAVVGDTTIVAYRSSYVDFTLPYSESGITMVVLMKRDERDNMWIFLKPLSPKLWFVTGLAFFVTGLVVWVLEHRINTEFRGTPEQQLGTVIWFSFSTLVFAHRERPENNLTRFVLIIWIFVVLIISQSYTASLASMLTVQRMHPAFVDVKEIKRNNYFVGHQKDSFVKDFLKKELHFNDTMLREYSTPEEYHDALSRGSHNGGVAAIFDEIPYVRRFLDKYRCSKFQMVGPTYQTDGFGFAFPLDSPLVSHISRAILNVTEDHDKMEAIKRKSFGREITCEDQEAETSSGGLRLSSFAGLFLISGVASVSSLLIYIIKFLCSNYPASNTMHEEQSVWLRILEVAKRFDQKDPSIHHLRRTESRVHPVTGPESIGASPETGNVHEMTSNEGAEDVGENQNHNNLISGNSGTNFIASNAGTVAPNTPERN